MLHRLLPAVLLCAGTFAADTLQLKDNATITGRILSEKPDQVAIDVGYTVLVVPKSTIAKISAEEKPAVASAAEQKEATNQKPPASAKIKPQFFQGGRANATDRSVREMVNELGEAVVQVRTPSGLGSGFFINDQGYLITNFHVIEGETQISVEVYHQKNGELDRKTYKQVRIIAMNKFADLTLLKVEDKDAPLFSWVLLGESDSLAVGERVFAIGSPLGLERTVTEGILSTKTRQMQGELYLQTTAQINPGNSGGPLFNMRGEVVGVTNMKLAFGEGLGFAIPIESVKYFLNHRDAFAYDNDNPSNAYRYLDPPSRARKTELQ
jgi:serine protease Do